MPKLLTRTRPGFPLSALSAALLSALPATSPAADQQLAPVEVRASADASAGGVPAPYAGGQVARGSRVGILGNQSAMDTPFSTTSYTNELIQDRQARSVGDVLQNDPGVRVARGFGNFQESYFVRGFVLGSDSVAYNGLYGLMPRQYIAAELFERVELLRGASAFLNGASPGGDALGGSINLLPKRAPNEPLSRVAASLASGGQRQLAADVARRFGPDDSTGVRAVAVRRAGGTGIDGERAELSLASVGLDWRSRDVRLSGDIGYQEHELSGTRTNVTLGSGVTAVPRAPDPSRNFARSWTFSNERDVFGTLRGEVDLSERVTAWGAWGFRQGTEANSLANLRLADAATGAATTARFDNAREDRVGTGEAGLRGKFRTGAVGHEWVASVSRFELESRNAYASESRTQATNLYFPTDSALLPFSASALRGGDLAAPGLTARTRLSSVAVGDTLSFIDDRLRLTLGLRHQDMRIEGFAYGTGALASSYDRSRTSPMAGVVFKAHPGVSLYANYIEGLTRGETAPTTASNRGQMLAPYVAKQKEVGLKLDRGRVGGGLALFSTTRPRGVIGANDVFSGQGEDRHQGLELTVYGEPVRGVKLLGGATWIDAEQVDTGSSATDGKRVIGVPRFQATIGAEWAVPGVDRLALDARVVHTGSRQANAANTLSVDGFTRLDVGARYLVEVDGRLVTLRARLDNVTDRAYWASVGGYPGQGYLVLGAPRTLTVSASVDF